MKTEFEFTVKVGSPKATSKIVNYHGKRSYITIVSTDIFGKATQCVDLSGKSLETFAVNILKALKSKKLKP